MEQSSAFIVFCRCLEISFSCFVGLTKQEAICQGEPFYIGLLHICFGAGADHLLGLYRTIIFQLFRSSVYFLSLENSTWVKIYVYRILCNILALRNTVVKGSIRRLEWGWGIHSCEWEYRFLRKRVYALWKGVHFAAFSIDPDGLEHKKAYQIFGSLEEVFDFGWSMKPARRS